MGEFANKKKTVKQEVLSLGFKLSLCSILVAKMAVAAPKRELQIILTAFNTACQVG